MAEVFERFKSSVNRGITTISVKTSSSLEKSKLKTHIESLQSDIKKLYYVVGEKFYENWASESSTMDQLPDLLESIKQKKQEILDLTASLESIDDRDNQILGNVKPEPKPEVKKFICFNCGAQYDAPVNFCRSCGQKLQ
ncbi:MAG: zinc ribbon domain-containing protein [Clostridia bacterium]|nr:zinc ribbon domain-containing protein [Clostridia bacterium]